MPKFEPSPSSYIYSAKDKEFYFCPPSWEQTHMQDIERVKRLSVPEVLQALRKAKGKRS